MAKRLTLAKARDFNASVRRALAVLCALTILVASAEMAAAAYLIVRYWQ